VKRREFLKKSLLPVVGTPAFLGHVPLWSQGQIDVMSQREVLLDISQSSREIDSSAANPILINNSFPGPLLRWREGDDLSIKVINNLNEKTSIHWHGILLPFQMDGVPGLSFDGIDAHSEFEYRFKLRQSGTYWYHSHSGFQEQIGHYGPIIIDPIEDDGYDYDREFVILISDWSFEDPQRIFNKLKSMSDNYNYQQRILGDLVNEMQEEGISSALSRRMMWSQMRMNETDIADVTGSTYKYLLNGMSTNELWRGIYSPGEKIRLRMINASAMSIFNVRIPGLPMNLIEADGERIRPIETDEIQLGTGEVFDAIIEPTQDIYTIFCESNDRSGFVAGAISTSASLVPNIPALRSRPTLTMKDMGMDHSAMGHDMSMMNNMDHSTMDHSSMGHNMSMMNNMDHSTMDHSAMGHDMSMMGTDEQVIQTHNHPRDHGVINLAENPVSRLAERPLGLEQEPHRVLTYSEISAFDHYMTPNIDREIELHLTSNMERYMWSFDGIKFSEVREPITFGYDEMIRANLVNDTMMPHPIHLHGMYFRLVNGPMNHPKKHTLLLKPGEKVSIDIRANEPGYWAFHCHFLYHMMAGMMRVIKVDNEV
jgi:CopA family copper-resistance protein